MTPPGWPATKDEITYVLIFESQPIFGYHEQEYLLRMKTVELAVFVGHSNEFIKCSFALIQNLDRFV